MKTLHNDSGGHFSVPESTRSSRKTGDRETNVKQYWYVTSELDIIAALGYQEHTHYHGRGVRFREKSVPEKQPVQ